MMHGHALFFEHQAMLSGTVKPADSHSQHTQVRATKQEEFLEQLAYLESLAFLSHWFQGIPDLHTVREKG